MSDSKRTQDLSRFSHHIPLEPAHHDRCEKPFLGVLWCGPCGGSPVGELCGMSSDNRRGHKVPLSLESDTKSESIRYATLLPKTSGRACSDLREGGWKISLTPDKNDIFATTWLPPCQSVSTNNIDTFLPYRFASFSPFFFFSLKL